MSITHRVRLPEGQQTESIALIRRGASNAGRCTGFLIEALLVTRDDTMSTDYVMHWGYEVRAASC